MKNIIHAIKTPKFNRQGKGETPLTFNPLTPRSNL